MELKPPTTVDEQIKLLLSRGCIIDDVEEAKSLLNSVNYYKLTAYILPFKTKDGLYTPGLTLKRIQRIYEFDKLIRNVTLLYLEEVELMLRARISQHFACKYGALGHLDSHNFNERNKHKDFHEKFTIELDHLINKNQSLLFVQHYKEKYENNFPLWVAIELFTFGMLSTFYKKMKIEDQKAIARNDFSTSHTNLSNWLQCMTIMRNSCAHYSRLYFRAFPVFPATPSKMARLNNWLFDYFLTMKFLYQDKSRWNNVFIPTISTIITEYSDSIELKHIGFPSNWKLQLYKQ